MAAISIGIARRISDSSAYNLLLPLPFVEAFCLLSFPESSAAIWCFRAWSIAGLYFLPLWLAGELGDLLPLHSPWFSWGCIITVLAAGIGIAFYSSLPGWVSFCVCLSAGFVFVAHLGESHSYGKDIDSAVLLIILVLRAVALAFFVLAIFWYLDHHIFSRSVAAFVGVGSLSPASIKIAWIVFATLGYTLYYLSQHLHDDYMEEAKARMRPGETPGPVTK